MNPIKEPSIESSDCYPNNIDVETLLEFDDSGEPMHIKQYSKLIERKLQCKKCGSKQFTVAQEDYLTAIRCETCKYELLIHQG